MNAEWRWAMDLAQGDALILIGGIHARSRKRYQNA